MNVENYKGLKILITGAQGYVGAALTEALKDIAGELVLVDVLPKVLWLPTAAKAQPTYIAGDVSHLETWQHILPKVDVVFHLAAVEQPYAGPQDIIREYEINVSSLLHFFAAAQALRIQPKLIFSSSANLFAGDGARPVTETDLSQPRSIWSAHKLLAENYVRQYAHDHNWPAIILRLANVYGPDPRHLETPPVVLNRVIKQALTTHTLTLFKNADYYRDYIYIDDVVAGLLQAGLVADQAQGNYFVLSSGDGLTLAQVWQALAYAVEKATGQAVTTRRDDQRELRWQEMRHFVGDSTAFRKLSGWQPQVSLTAGLTKTIETLR